MLLVVVVAVVSAVVISALVGVVTAAFSLSKPIPGDVLERQRKVMICCHQQQGSRLQGSLSAKASR